MKTPKKRKRPTTTTTALRRLDRVALTEAVCQRIEDGELVDDAAKAEGTTRKSIWQWAREDAALGDRYTRAREASAESLELEAIDVARKGTNDTAAADRLLVDTLKWAAAKRRPKVYGDRLNIDADLRHTAGVVRLPARDPE